LIDSEVWLGLPVDVKGNIYEGLLARNAEDVKSGAGQYFTPRALIEAMVQVVDPKPHQTIHDPACGTAGFLLAAWEHMKQHPKARDRGVYSALKNKFSVAALIFLIVNSSAFANRGNSICRVQCKHVRRRRSVAARRDGREF
jgi:type I restriction enzyme M protein